MKAKFLFLLFLVCFFSSGCGTIAGTKRIFFSEFKSENSFTLRDKELKLEVVSEGAETNLSARMLGSLKKDLEKQLRKDLTRKGVKLTENPNLDLILKVTIQRAIGNTALAALIIDVAPMEMKAEIQLISLGKKIFSFEEKIKTADCSYGPKFSNITPLFGVIKKDILKKLKENGYL